jgi:hypothetical protein
MVIFGQAIQDSVISVESKITASMTCQLLNAFEECISIMLQMGCGKKNMHGSLVTVEHTWNPPCTNFLFSQGGGEDTVNTCWRDSTCSMRHCCWGSTVKSIVSLFLAIFSGIYASAKFHMKKPVTKPSFNDF